MRWCNGSTASCAGIARARTPTCSSAWAAPRTLQRDASPGLRWKAYTTPAATHADNARKATPVALRWIAGDDACTPPP
jgi:hypothetical protein